MRRSSLSVPEWLLMSAAGAAALFCLTAAMRLFAVRAFDFPVTLAVNILAARSRIFDHSLQAVATFDLFQGVAILALAYGCAFAPRTDGEGRIRLAVGIFAAAAAQPLMGPPPVEVVQSMKPVQPSLHCEASGGVQMVDTKAQTPVRAQKLNELPNANAYKAVIRVDEHGCPKPLIVRYNIGSARVKQR